MPNYDFKTLSPIDFEILSRDLLREELGIRLENFKSGRDRGIDLRYCTDGENSVIVQCKHFAESSFNLLRREYKEREVEKIKKLNPKRYIVVTSLGLTPDNKDEIVEMCSPYINTPSDVLGKDDLNGLLVKFPKVERHTFKLWLTSIPILEELLHSKLKNVSRDALGKIQNHAKYYVKNESFHDAIRILDKYNFCIIAGIPGIGKTILAEMLSLHYVDLGYEIVKITGDISEAMAVDYVNQKRVFFYDDFLGQAALSEKLNKNEDQKLLDFIHTIHFSKVSKLILTTREYILHQAQLIYEKLSREKFDAETCIIDLKKYNRLNRAQILYNHIYFSDLTGEFKNALLEKRNYLKVIDHHNYNPRIVDLMTQYSRIGHVSASEYFKFFMFNLDNPLEIWRHAFEEQLSDNSRNLLIVMASMPEYVFVEDLQEAFLSFHLKQGSVYKFETSPNDFMHALKEAEGNFIAIEKSRDRRMIRFHNPSIRDYLREYISSNEQVLRSLVIAATFYDQHMILWEFREEQSELLKYRKVLVKYQSEFLRALAYSINFETCRLINFKGSGGETYKEKWSMSFEARATLMISVALELKSELSFKLLWQVLEIINQRMVNNQSNREDLVRFLKEYNKGAGIIGELRAAFISNAKTYFTTDIDSLYDLEEFWEFRDIFPGIIDGALLTSLEAKFIEVAEEDLYYNPEDPDFYRDDAYKIEKLAKRFNIDMKRRIEALEDRAQELDAEQPGDPHDDYEGYGGGGGGGEAYSDGDIDSLFGTLEK